MSRFCGMTVAAVIIALGLQGAQGQGVTQWKGPPRPLTLDFSWKNSDRKVNLTPAGAVFEIPVRFMLVGPPPFVLMADAGLPGSLAAIIADPACKADVRPVTSQGNRQQFEVLRRFTYQTRRDITQAATVRLDKLLGPGLKVARREVGRMNKNEQMRYVENNGGDGRLQDDDLRKEAIRVHAAKFHAREIQEQLRDVARRKPHWLSQVVQRGWATDEAARLERQYRLVVECELIEAYLHEVGLDLNSDVAEFHKLLEEHFEGVELILSAQAETVGDASKRVAKLLNAKDVVELHKSLGVSLTCSFLPQANPKDPNSNWFCGQRVACRANGLASIAVNGRLDPGQGDWYDWWILDGYDPSRINLIVPADKRFVVEPPMVTPQGTVLRVLATGNASADYRLVFDPITKVAGPSVELRETGLVGAIAFPY